MCNKMDTWHARARRTRGTHGRGGHVAPRRARADSSIAACVTGVAWRRKRNVRVFGSEREMPVPHAACASGDSLCRIWRHFAHIVLACSGRPGTANRRSANANRDATIGDSRLAPSIFINNLRFGHRIRHPASEPCTRPPHIYHYPIEHSFRVFIRVFRNSLCACFL